MLEALQQILSALAKLFLGIFAKQQIPAAASHPIEPPTPIITPIEPYPIPVPAPVTTPPVVSVSGSIPAPPTQVNSLTGHYIIPSGHGPQSSWWDGTYRITQDWGCTDYAPEGHNPFHPECKYWHEGIDYALPCGTKVFAGSYVSVIAIDPPGWGGAAIQLRLSNWDIWLMHMNDYAVRVGQKLNPGDLIGHSGTRGNSTGCHLHFEVNPANGIYRKSVNPVPMVFFPSKA